MVWHLSLERQKLTVEMLLCGIEIFLEGLRQCCASMLLRLGPATALLQQTVWCKNRYHT